MDVVISVGLASYELNKNDLRLRHCKLEGI